MTSCAKHILRIGKGMNGNMYVRKVSMYTDNLCLRQTLI